MIKLRDFFFTYVYERMNQSSKTIFIFNQFKKQWIRSIILLKERLYHQCKQGYETFVNIFSPKLQTENGDRYTCISLSKNWRWRLVNVVVWEIKYKLYLTIKHNFNATCPVNWKDKYIKTSGICIHAYWSLIFTR